MKGRRTEPQPPWLARLLATLGVAPEDRGPALADLAERFRRVADDRGPAAARRWYWWQAVRGLGHRLRPDPTLVRRWSWSGFRGDIRHRARGLARRPAYAAGVVGTLALGLASAVVVGSLAWHVWLAPMPFADPDRVVRLFEVEPPDPAAGADASPTRWRLSPPLLEDLRAHDWATVQAVAGVGHNVLDWERDEASTRVTALTASPELFEVLGIRPLEGRLPSDDADAAELLLTDEFWERTFGADPSVVGSAEIALDGRSRRVVGVVDLPDAYPGDADVVIPFAWTPEQLVTGMRGARYLDVIARIGPGFDVKEASAEMARLVEAAGRVHPNHEGWGGEAVALASELVRPYRGVLALLLAAGSAFLALAVVNVAGLVAARSVEGRAERGIRLALGASEWRLLRGSLVESGLVAGLAAALALVLIRWLLGPIKALVPAEVPRVAEVAVGPGTIAALVAVAAVAGCIVGAVGHALSRGAGPASARPGARGSERAVGRRSIVVSQVALTTILAATGAAILRTVVDMQSVDLGFSPAGVVSSQAMLTAQRYPTPDTRLALWRALLDELEGRGVPAAVATSPPMAGVNMPWGHRVDATADQAFAQYHVVSPGFFGIMGIDVLEGRGFTEEDHPDASAVVVVNDVLAREAFAGASAVGRRIQVVADEKTIVGVVEGTRHFGPAQDVPREIYAPFTQDPWPHAQILARGGAETAGAALTAAAERVDPTLGLPPPSPYDRFVREWYAGLRLQLVIVGALAAVGLLLATLGLYALIAYRVSARQHEIGVRMALGASGRLVFRGVLRQGMALAGVGLVVGLAAWYAVAPMARSWLDDVRVGDPWIPVLVGALVVATSALATVIPARRSTAVDPATSLREE